MIRHARLTLHLNDVNCLTQADLAEKVAQIAAKIREVHLESGFAARVEIDEEQPHVQATAHGKAQLDAFIKVKRARGGPLEHYYVLNGENVPITQEQYDEAHK